MTEEQVIRLIPLLPYLTSGFSFKKGKPPTISRQTKTEAGFVPDVEIAAGLNARLESAGDDGLMLQLIYTLSAVTNDVVSVMHHMARFKRVSYEEIDRRRAKALEYVSGEKKRGFKQWRQHKKGS